MDQVLVNEACITTLPASHSAFQETLYNHDAHVVDFAGDTHFTSIEFPTLSPVEECASMEVTATLDSQTTSAISITVNDVDKRLEIVYSTINVESIE